MWRLYLSENLAVNFWSLILIVGCYGWNIIFIVTENRCHSGTEIFLCLLCTCSDKNAHSSLNMSPHISYYLYLFFQRNGSKLFAVGTTSSLVPDILFPRNFIDTLLLSIIVSLIFIIVPEMFCLLSPIRWNCSVIYLFCWN